MHLHIHSKARRWDLFRLHKVIRYHMAPLGSDTVDIEHDDLAT